MPKLKQLTPKQLSIAVEYYEDGSSAREITNKIPVSYTTLLKRLREKGIEIRKSGFSKDSDYDEMSSKWKMKKRSKKMERWGFKNEDEMEKHFTEWRLKGRKYRAFR